MPKRVKQSKNKAKKRAASNQSSPLPKFGAAGARVLVEEADALVGAGAIRDWLPRVFAAFARLRPLHVVETRGYPWIEIDFREDYWRACAEVLPAIAELDAAADRRRAALVPARSAASLNRHGRRR
jgi:hypothetical protein